MRSQTLQKHHTIDKSLIDSQYPSPPPPIQHDLDYPIKGDMKPWVDRFNADESRLRPLLGEALYEGIRDTYGKETQQQR